MDCITPTNQRSRRALLQYMLDCHPSHSTQLQVAVYYSEVVWNLKLKLENMSRRNWSVRHKPNCTVIKQLVSYFKIKRDTKSYGPGNKVYALPGSQSREGSVHTGWPIHRNHFQWLFLKNKNKNWLHTPNHFMWQLITKTWYIFCIANIKSFVVASIVHENSLL